MLLKISKMMNINANLLHWFIKFSIKSLLCLHINLLPVVLLKVKLCQSKNFLKNYTNQILENTKSQKVHSSFIENVSGGDLADMQLEGKFNEGIRFLLCAIDILSNFAWVIPLKGKKGIRITNAFQKILDRPNRKANKIWVDKESEFYNRSMKSWF